MKKFILISVSLIIVSVSFSQSAADRIQSAYLKFESDSQLRHATNSLYVVDAKTGEIVFEKNSQVGLAGASTQKVITAVTAFDVLGSQFRYRTAFGVSESPGTGKTLLIRSSGDPTFGSWRWKATSPDTVLNKVIRALKKNNRLGIQNILFDNSGWDNETIPDGWIWQDIGNYYGAGAHKFNYRENQYEIFLKSGSSIGDSVMIADSPDLEEAFSSGASKISSKLTSAGKGTGDNAYVYLPGDMLDSFKIRGTIPINEQKFSISASATNPDHLFFSGLKKKLMEAGAKSELSTFTFSKSPLLNNIDDVLYAYYSPSLDSIVYWFLKKSINLYGEALVKTIGFNKTGIGSTDSGVAVVKKFWKDKGYDEDEFNIYDGSGLSPLNRITTHAQVEVLKYARYANWYKYFYDALPEFNGMKMKSGTISDVKGFCGYQKSNDGHEYIFSFLVNNYSGRTSSLVNKMYKVLDELK
jgi:D-alanyl-D-alanine carboxypeptidase/D-alanyl-D-alanine-endopeptidase (penicillin-binding protein 4)